MNLNSKGKNEKNYSNISKNSFLKFHQLPQTDEEKLNVIRKVETKLTNESAYSKKRRLLATIGLLEHIIKTTNLEAGDYKIKFKPEKGSEFISIHPLLRLSDVVGFKILRDENFTIAPFRHKNSWSQTETTCTEFGAQPLIKNYTKYKDVKTLLPELEKFRIQISKTEIPKKAEKLQKIDWLIKLVEKRLEERKELIYESCNNDSKKLNKLYKLLKEYNEKIKEINQEHKKRSEVHIHLPEKMFLEAAGNPPITLEKIKNNPEISQKIKNETLYDLLIGVHKSIGTDVLEVSTYDLIELLDNALKRICKEKGIKIEDYADLFLKIKNLIENLENIDRKIENLLFKPYLEKKETLESITQILKQRKEMYNLLKNIYQIVGTIAHEKEHNLYPKTVVATIIVNLCKISDKEIEAWKEVGEQLKSQHRLHNKILTFIENAIGDEKTIYKMKTKSDEGSSNFKENLKGLEEELEQIIEKIKENSEAIGEILFEAYSETKSHNDYKMKIKLLEDPHYYLAVSELLFTIAQIKGIEKYKERLNNYLKENVEIYKLADELGLTEEIKNHIKRFEYIKEKGYDIEADPKLLRKQNFSGKEIIVSYKPAFNQNNQPVLSLDYGNTTIEVPILENISFENFQTKSSDIEENIYGVRFSLEEQIGKKEVNVQEIYEYVTTKASENLNRFLAIKKEFEEKKLGPHFISTIIYPGKLDGVLMKINYNNSSENNSSEILKIKPTILNKNNTNIKEKLEDIFPTYQEASDEAFDYLFQKQSIRIFRELNRTLPYWVLKIAEKLAENQ
jgi:hypothetical protein